MRKSFFQIIVIIVFITIPIFAIEKQIEYPLSFIISSNINYEYQFISEVNFNMKPVRGTMRIGRFSFKDGFSAKSLFAVLLLADSFFLKQEILRSLIFIFTGPQFKVPIKDSFFFNLGIDMDWFFTGVGFVSPRIGITYNNIFTNIYYDDVSKLCGLEFGLQTQLFLPSF